MYKLPNFEIRVNPPKPKPDPQPLWFFHLVKASLVKLAKFGNIYHSGHKILISVLAAFYKAKKPDGLAIRYGFGWVQRYLRQATWGATPCLVEGEKNHSRAETVFSLKLERVKHY